MASFGNRFVSRTSFQTLKSAIKSKVQSPSLSGSASSLVPNSTASTSSSVPCRRFSSFTTRLCPVQLGCAQSLLPLHSAVAVARMTSCLSSNSRSCRALSQGSLCCTSPGL
ncbi:hypothetical protein Scep_007045 [Stephania cephalantha]|uniref:Uncharacterized protein n=1 Tax=Stephania cephalantha TaxID=152367 RepID=A0AAP0K903_9MAGN